MADAAGEYGYRFQRDHRGPGAHRVARGQIFTCANRRVVERLGVSVVLVFSTVDTPLGSVLDTRAKLASAVQCLGVAVRRGSYVDDGQDLSKPTIQKTRAQLTSQGSAITVIDPTAP